MLSIRFQGTLVSFIFCIFLLKKKKRVSRRMAYSFFPHPANIPRGLKEKPHNLFMAASPFFREGGGQQAASPLEHRRLYTLSSSCQT
jgi:hypothetical protein